MKLFNKLFKRESEPKPSIENLLSILSQVQDINDKFAKYKKDFNNIELKLSEYYGGQNIIYKGKVFMIKPPMPSFGHRYKKCGDVSVYKIDQIIQ